MREPFWQRGLNRQIQAVAFTDRIWRERAQHVTDQDVRDEIIERQVAVGHILRHADLFAFEAGPCAACRQASQSVPLSITNREFSDQTIGQAAAQLWWFGEAFQDVTADCVGVKGPTSLEALLVYRSEWETSHSRQIEIVIGERLTREDSESPMIFVTRFIWPDNLTLEGCLARLAVQMPTTWDGSVIPADRLDVMRPLQRIVVSFVAAAHVWLRQRILRVDAGAIERHTGKRAARVFGRPSRLSTVKVIGLRRYESHVASLEGSRVVDWSCRWIVNGHWRRQWYPARQQHELLYIEPYVKGPPDQPLRVADQTIYAVSR